MVHQETYTGSDGQIPIMIGI